MKKLFLSLALSLLVISCMLLTSSQENVAHAQIIPSATPTYDPLAEPILPENPSEFELGQNWYWHHCMPCHGDMGQGLTDEFRAIWPEEHQNCWGYGCHAGVRKEDSFKVPTSVPSIINDEKLARFSSLQDLYEFLKATHPPQYPGFLPDEQYSAIAFYLFSMNNRLLVESTPTPQAPTHTPTLTIAVIDESNTSENIIPLLVMGGILLLVIIWGLRKNFNGRAEGSHP